MKRDPYPLHWPDGWPRTGYRAQSKFRVASFARERDSVVRQVRMLGGSEIVITSNLPIRNDGLPYANASEPADPGIAVWWRARDGSERVMACDRWRRYRDNIHAVSLSLAALRGLNRWGSSEIVERAFKGFAALPPAGHDWRAVFPDCRTLDDVKEAFRRAVGVAHPDKHGGNDAEMVRLNAAYAAAKLALA